MSPTAKRALFVTPSPAKRRRMPMRQAKLKLSQMPRSVVPETKFKDYFLEIASTQGSGFVQIKLLQGDDGDDFVGSKVYLKSLDISYATDRDVHRLSVIVP